MKKILSILIVLLCVPMMINALEVNLDYHANIGGSSYEYYYSIIQDSNGNYVTVGEFNSTSIDDIVNNGGTDALIVKYDDENNIIWKKNFGGNSTDKFYKVVEVKDGGYVAVGEIYSNDVEGLSNVRYSEALVVKYDVDGNIVWKKMWGGDFADNFNSVAATDDGGFIAAGTVYSKDVSGIQLDGSADALIVKYDKDGNVEWQKDFGGSSYEFFQDVKVTKDGEYVAVGRIDSVDVAGITSKGSYDALIVKYDKEGNVIWQKSYGGSDFDRFEALTISENGESIVVCYSKSKNIEGAPNKGNGDGIIVKYDNLGNIVWQTVWGGNSLDALYGINNAKDECFIVVGQASSTNITNFESDGSYTGAIVKLDKEGKVQWSKGWGGRFGDYFRSVVQNEKGEYVVSGFFMSDDIDGLNIAGSQDAVLVKFSVKYNINVLDSEYGSAIANQVDNIGNIKVTPNIKYIVDKINVKDSKDTLVDIISNGNDEFSFELYDDVTVEVIFKREYVTELNPTENGKATAEQYEDGKGRVNAVPDEGYELDTIVIKDTTGKEVVYEEKDGYYFFDVNDDLVITVTFKELPKEVVKGDEEEKEEENPKTADAFIYYACAVVSSLFGIWSVEQYRKTVKE